MPIFQLWRCNSVAWNPSFHQQLFFNCSRERNITPTPTFEASNLTTNAFDAKRGLGRGNLFTHCNKHGHTIDFCYKKHITLKFINLHHLLMLILILFKMARLQVTQLVHKFMWTLHLLSLHKSMTSLYVCYNKPTWFQSHLQKWFKFGNSSLEPISYNLGNISNYKFNLPYSSSNSHISNCYLTDSGANDRICSSLHFLDIFYRIKTLNVHLPNGSWVQMKYAGNVQISPFLSILIVLYSDVFKINLIYVSKLCQSLSISIKFTPTHYCFHRIWSSWRWLVWLVKWIDCTN